MQSSSNKQSLSSPFPPPRFPLPFPLTIPLPFLFPPPLSSFLFPASLSCASHALHMRFTCASHAPHMRFTCAPHAPHMRFTCASHAPHMRLTCASRATRFLAPKPTNQHPSIRSFPFTLPATLPPFRSQARSSHATHLLAPNPTVLHLNLFPFPLSHSPHLQESGTQLAMGLTCDSPPCNKLRKGEVDTEVGGAECCCEFAVLSSCGEKLCCASEAADGVRLLLMEIVDNQLPAHGDVLSLPPVSLPPVSLPPVSLPPVSLPPVSLPAVSLPPVSLPPVSLPPVSLR
ncbi:unnamed protein product [Closterium sp. Naga37s-1]|nr:unnamed protein product [Closterium sp. Naga37s-1]